MRKNRLTETRIVKILKEVEAGRQVKEVCREYSISDQTCYNWKSKYKLAGLALQFTRTYCV